MSIVAKITSEKFHFYQAAIALYGCDILHIEIQPPPLRRSLPFSLEEDVFLPVMPKRQRTTLKLRLCQFSDAQDSWWQYVNEGEI
ncbi:hypothetical protein FD723_40185 (plasmid) [Nostoc sp. C052]|uniref:hypothetical protein n=1 Tax=Nostoc sp. C052 TaxID=2576902 RepID=UPI0015C3FFE4|nr:hypothetical protein [Nostoc sp. C052]QLE46433.1 hypothetical protein FD723_40185 [Nostoc sp. C052]